MNGWHPYPSSSGSGPCPICGKPVADPIHSSRLAEAKIRFVNQRPSANQPRYDVLLNGVSIGSVLRRADIYPWATYTSWIAYLPDGTRNETYFSTRSAAAAFLIGRAS